MLAAVGLWPTVVAAVQERLDPPPAAWQPLLDGTLSRWEVWTGVPVGESRPIGLGDPRRLFTVHRDATGAWQLRVSGEVYGGLTTRAEYANYHLTLEMKWGTKKWPPRLTEKRDSGLLYHCEGPHGAFWNVWMRCLEFQIQETDFGDLHQLAGPKSLVRMRNKAWSPSGAVVATSLPVTKLANHEKAHGKWNRLDLYVVGDRAVHVVNGVVVLAVDGARTAAGQPLRSGKLQLQSEAAECIYRDVRIRPLASIPAGVARQAGW